MLRSLVSRPFLLDPAHRCVLIAIAALCLFPHLATAQHALTTAPDQQRTQPGNDTATTHDLTISSAKDWTDTGLTLAPGDALQIALEPPGTNNNTQQLGCESASPASTAGELSLRVNSTSASTLVAKLAANAQPFPVIESRTVSIVQAGHLFLAPNVIGSCPIHFAVKVRVGPATATVIKGKLANAAQVWLSGQFGAKAASNASPVTGTAANHPGTSVSKSTPALEVSSQPLDSQLRKDIDHLPRRVNDQFNNEGDMVNFVIIGSQQQVQNALGAANWHLADTSNSDAITKAIEMTRQNQDYVQMPMSLLYLFGRVQDFGYEQAEPYAVVASRHHFRLWKAPFVYKGEPVWVGAGTHDIGFEKDQRNGSVTHKIDPEVDQERLNIGTSLQKTGLVQALSEYLPPDPVQSAKNATGGGYQSDGRILVIRLK